MATKAFISYSHDSQPHSQRVLQLANQLRGHGVDAALDQYETRPPQGWARWCEEQLRPDLSDFVLVICTEIYLQRIEGRVSVDEGRGVFWEGNVIYNYIYNQKSNSRFIPVLFDRKDEAYIPLPLQGSTRYRLGAFDLTDSEYEALYRELTRQPAVTKPPLGEVVRLGERMLGYGADDELTVLPAVARREARSTFPVPEAMPTEDELLEALKSLPAAWFDQLVFRFDKNNAVAGKQAPQATRALDLLVVVQALEGGPARLQSEVRRLKSGR